MNTPLLIAGLLCVGMVLAHATIGLIWVLPHLTEDRLPKTPFWFVRRRPRHLLRLPVPLLWVVVAVLCWTASA